MKTFKINAQDDSQTAEQPVAMLKAFGPIDSFMLFEIQCDESCWL